MAEDYKSSKTRHVMNLITARSESNPFLPASTSTRHKKEEKEASVEDRLQAYTASKRGKPAIKKQKNPNIKNPSLHLPETEEAEVIENEFVEDICEEAPAPKRSAEKKKEKLTEVEKVTIDINRIILADMLDEALTRFNTCHCDKCKNAITEQVLKIVPVKIVTIPQGEEKATIEKYCEYTKKEISSAIVKVVMANKRQPFHG
ncbi:MAG: hypothetical protein E7490_04195 [Ruminococcaceae bacterium]|nr:hypothetical protein [Oscillospiraceae bacterium]